MAVVYQTLGDDFAVFIDTGNDIATLELAFCSDNTNGQQAAAAVLQSLNCTCIQYQLTLCLEVTGNPLLTRRLWLIFGQL